MNDNIDYRALGRGTSFVPVPPQPDGSPPPYPGAGPPPLDANLLGAEWLRVRREVELAMDRGIVPGAGYVYDPRLDILRARIKERWATLPTPEAVAECLVIVRKMHDQVAAAIFGYAFLRAALMLRGDSYQAENIADFEVAYLRSVGVDPAEAHADVVQAQARRDSDEDDAPADDL